MYMRHWYHLPVSYECYANNIIALSKLQIFCYLFSTKFDNDEKVLKVRRLFCFLHFFCARFYSTMANYVNDLVFDWTSFMNEWEPFTECILICLIANVLQWGKIFHNIHNSQTSAKIDFKIWNEKRTNRVLIINIDCFIGNTYIVIIPKRNGIDGKIVLIF